MTREEMLEEEPELIGKTYDELCAEQSEEVIEEEEENPDAIIHEYNINHAKMIEDEHEK